MAENANDDAVSNRPALVHIGRLEFESIHID